MAIAQRENILRLASDRVLGFMELKQDLIFHKIPRESYENYIDGALQGGDEAAREVSRVANPGGEGKAPTRTAPSTPLSNDDLCTLAALLQARVLFIEKPNVLAGVVTRAEYSSGDGTITVFRQSIAQVKACLDRAWPELGWTEEGVATIHLAHELFHHLEASRIGLTNEKFPKVLTFRLGFWKTFASIRRLREIAAHKFTKELLKLPFLPNLIDYLILVGQGKLTEAELISGLRMASEELKREDS